MVSGDLTPSTILFATTAAEVFIAVDSLNLAAVTDTLHILPKNQGYLVFKVEREA